MSKVAERGLWDAKQSPMVRQNIFILDHLSDPQTKKSSYDPIKCLIIEKQSQKCGQIH